MPPYGLYPVPRHHLYGGTPTTRPVFNTMDFSNDKSELVGQPVNEAEEGDSKKRDKKDKEKKDKKDKKDKKKKRKSKDKASDDLEVTGTSTSLGVNAPPAPPSSKNKKSKDRKKENDANGVDDARVSTKKRKRDSAAEVETATAPSNQLSTISLFDSNFLDIVKTSVGTPATAFDPPGSTPLTSEKSPKKKVKSSNKTEEGGTKETTNEGSSNAVPAATPSGDGSAKKKRGRPSKSTLMQAPETPTKTAVSPVASPLLSVPRRTPVSLPQNSPSRLGNTFTERRTHVPLPPKSPSRLSTAVSEAREMQAKSDLQGSQVLVTETPPSHMLKKSSGGFDSTPIPFNAPHSSTMTDRKKPRQSLTLQMFSPSTDEEGRIRTGVGSTLSQGADSPSPSATLLSSANLHRFKKPINKLVNSRSRGRSSSVTSTRSSTSSMHLGEAFAIANKPNSHSGAETDPFAALGVNDKTNKHVQKHSEATKQDFTDQFRASRKSVNFPDEKKYLDGYLTWREDNNAAGPPPCLNKATGCTPKRENLLRLSKEDSKSSKLINVLLSGPEGAVGVDASALDTAVQRTASAESLLSLAVAARVPVPLDRIDGTWKLFCPQYSAVHVDKYGFGQRTLSIASLAGSESDGGMYTARLSIPPRSTIYSLLDFKAPPHASFRSIHLQTSTEGYAVEIVFLGNGYLTMRADVHLLLMGKKAEGIEGKRGGLMEFVGVREGSVQWVEKKGELNEEGKKLSTK